MPPIPSTSTPLDLSDPQPPSSSSNPFHIFTPPEDTPSPIVQSDPSESPLPLIIPSSLPPNPPSARTSKSNSKEHGATLDNQKKNRSGRKSAKQQRDENAHKDIAMGTQNPIESYILGQIDKDSVNKEQGGRATLCNPHLK